MFNLITADLKRYVSHWGFWLTIASCIILFITRIMEASSTFVRDGGEIFGYLMAGSMSMIFVNLYIIVMIGDEIDLGLHKNVLIVGSSRSKYFLAKLITSYLLSTLFFGLYAGGGTGLVIFLYGSSGFFTADLLLIFFSQLLVLFATISVGLCLIFVFRNAKVTLISYSGMIFIPQLIISLFPNSERILSFEPSQLLMRLVVFSELTGAEVMQILSVSMGYIAISVAISLLVFRKCEIK